MLHRLSGARELPQARSPLTGGSFSASADRGTRTAPGAFAPDGRLLLLHLSRELRSAERGDSPRPRRRAKRKGHLRFPFLFELLPFPCFLIWRRLPTCDRSETGVRQRIFSSVSFATCSQCQIPFCYTCDLICAGATYPCRAIRLHVVTPGTCECRRSAAFILVDPVCNNALTNCAALLSPRGPSLALRAIHLVPRLRR